uniref:Translation initiation factor eIF2B subunit epsilon n=1 Tax=Albugo laibachii Nc14 TaxID=890382 RepID=F0W909_9STRA|nr:translation initiation factor eIF2B subunit epsilon putative [Albugo laibachii Nc14]|eukprot:CCA17620.1 translation initiation factor eIF2B subunit epsilon putative [Albugo laibachii Nc14]
MKGKASPSVKDADIQRDTLLQAIIFAEFDTQAFLPISAEKAQVLLPVANVPVIEYAMEALVSSGVQEIIVFCSQHYSSIKSYIENVSRISKQISVRCITSCDCSTVGDALREVDQQQLIHSDPFIMMRGDVITNIDLKRALAKHQQLKKIDPHCVMTTIFKVISATFHAKSTYHNTNIRTFDDELVLGINSDTRQLLMYQNDPNRSGMKLSSEVMVQHESVSIRSDVFDSYIDICSPEVLLKFAENFDYQDIRQDFLHNEVQNHELGDKFYAYIDEEESFAGRIVDPRTYSGVTHAILQRWVYPMVPDNNYLSLKDTNYSYHRDFIYKDGNVKVPRTSFIGRGSIIGADTQFGENCHVIKSSIGSNCIIGNNVRIENSFLWSHVRIEDNVVIKNSILCDSVLMCKGSKILNGGILSFDVHIGEDVSLPPFSKVTTRKQIRQRNSSDFGSEVSQEVEALDTVQIEDAFEWNPQDVGKTGIGRLWSLAENEFELESDDDSEQGDSEEASRRLMELQFAKLKASMIDADDLIMERSKKWNEWESWTLEEEDDEPEDLPDECMTKNPSFERILHDLIIAGDRDGHDTDDLFLEIKSCKFAHNRTFVDVIHALIPALMESIQLNKDDIGKTLENVRSKFQKWHSVVERCLVDSSDQLAVLEALETYTIDPLHSITWMSWFRYLLQIVYDREWCFESVILEWYESREESAADFKVRALVKDEKVVEFIEWLRNVEEDSASDGSWAD